jgi:hypothetical protein
MAAAPPVSSENGGALQGQPSCVPPENSLWKRYSPHHELPVSVTTSAVAHAVFFALLVFGVLGAIFWRQSAGQPPPLGPVVEISNDGAPGGAGGDDAAGNGNPLQKVGPQDAQDPPAPPKPQHRREGELPKLAKPDVVQDIDFRIRADKEFADDPTETMKTLEKIDKETRDLLILSTTRRGPVGPGTGPSKGPREAAIDSTLDIHLLRALRWTMVFNTEDGQDYRRQLAGLTARMKEKTIVAIKQPDGRYRVFRDLESDRPASAIEDLSTMQRIFWVDDKPNSVRALSRALGLAQPPPSIAILFPEELENKLLRIELAHAGLREDQEKQIKETHFGIIRQGNSYEPVVTGQRLKPRP